MCNKRRFQAKLLMSKFHNKSICIAFEKQSILSLRILNIFGLCDWHCRNGIANFSKIDDVFGISREA